MFDTNNNDTNNVLIAISDKGVLYESSYCLTYVLIYKFNEDNNLYKEEFTSCYKFHYRKKELLRVLNPCFSIEVILTNGVYEGVLRANGKGIPVSLKEFNWGIKERFINRPIMKCSLLGDIWIYPLFHQLSSVIKKEVDRVKGEADLELVYDADLNE